jgi:serine/threonine protein kinase
MDRKAPQDQTRTLGQTGETSLAVGPYQLLQKIGEGGMGEVWVAEQHRPIRRRVALKLIKAGMDTRQVIARFESERQALAMMDHPAIAKIFDAGETPQGRPYFVMEYVPGIPITVHCDQNRLAIRERLELFNQICDGVQHAHQKAVIHRDLKPSNILVAIQDGKAVPKIIDFGVAKATGQSLTERTMFTEIGALIGTPEYMSPEQADMSGQDVDTRTDVYSLGAILYELLVGALPFDPKELRRAGFDEIRRRVRYEDPPKPSTKLSSMGDTSSIQAEHRSTERPALIRQVRGDLDWITMKALEKDRTRRYGSPSDLTADIDRYLNHQPIVARPPNTLYKTKKFIRRHYVGVSVASIVSILLVAFSVTTALQARRIARERNRANQEAETSRQVADFLTGLFRVSDPSEARGNSITAREILDKAAQNISVAMKDQPTLKGRLMSVIGEVFTNLGLYKEAEPLISDALATQRRVRGDADPETISSIHRLANLYWFLKREKDAERLYLELVGTCRRVYGEAHRETLRANWDLASLYYLQGRGDEGIKLTKTTLEIQRRVLPPDDPDIADSIGNLSSFYWAQGRYEEALPLNEDALERSRRTLGLDHPVTILNEFNLATIYQRLGIFDKAEPHYLSAISAWRRVLGREHPDTIHGLEMFASMYSDMKRYKEAESLLREVLATNSALLNPGQVERISPVTQLAEALQGEGNLSQAEELYRQEMETVQRLRGDHRFYRTYLLQGLGLLQSKRGQEEGISLLNESVRLMKILTPKSPYQILVAEWKLGRGLLELRRYHDAEPFLVQYYAYIKDNYGDKGDSSSKALMKTAVGPLVRLYEELGEPDKAKEYRSRLGKTDKGR